MPQARYAFVDGMVDLEVLALQVSAALPAVVEPDKAYADVVLRAFADQAGVACQAAGLVDQGRGGWPACVVEHGVVQRRQDALEHVSAAHDDPSLGNGAVNGALGAVTRTGPLQAVGVLNTAIAGPAPARPCRLGRSPGTRSRGSGGTGAADRPRGPEDRRAPRPGRRRDRRAVPPRHLPPRRGDVPAPGRTLTSAAATVAASPSATRGPSRRDPRVDPVEERPRLGRRQHRAAERADGRQVLLHRRHGPGCVRM